MFRTGTGMGLPSAARGGALYQSPITRNGLGFTIPIIGVDTSDVGDILGAVTSIFGGGGGSGIPAATAQAIVNKWYSLYLQRPADAGGLQHWVGEIQRDGVATAWRNFSNSPEPMQAGVQARAATLQSQGYGSPLDATGRAQPLEQVTITAKQGAGLPPLVLVGLLVGGAYLLTRKGR